MELELHFLKAMGFLHVSPEQGCAWKLRSWEGVVRASGERYWERGERVR